MSEVKLTEDEINEAAEEAYQNNELEDMMGNHIESSELVEQDVNEEKALTFNMALNVMKGTQGKVLTIIDATFTDKDRLKYVKDLIKDAFGTQANWLFELTHELGALNPTVKEN